MSIVAGFNTITINDAEFSLQVIINCLETTIVVFVKYIVAKVYLG